MDLVDDDRPRRRQHFAAGFGTDQDIERFRRGHDDVRRKSAHALPLSRRRVAGAHPGADLHIGQPLPRQRFADAGERGFEIALNVVGERLQRRHVDYLRLVRETAVYPLTNERVDRREKGGERLAGPGRCSDQGVSAGLDRRPSLGLRGGRRGKTALEPFGDSGMEEMGRVHARRAQQVKQILVACPTLGQPVRIFHKYGEPVGIRPCCGQFSPLASATTRELPQSHAISEQWR